MFIDIAANLSDDMFQGVYNEKKRHECDLDQVLDRAKLTCEKIILLAGTIHDAYTCLDICNKYDPECTWLFTTVGFHPLRGSELLELIENNEDAEKILLDNISTFIDKAGPNRVVALGEMGLDYHRLEYCEKDVQIRLFELQLRVASRLPQLPLLLHMRNAFQDFVNVIRKYPVTGVVHSFTGSREEMQTLVDMGFYIGINGCSLRDAFNIIPHVPEDKLLLETDSPYCDIRPTHPCFRFLEGLDLPKSVKPEKLVLGSLVRGRNEPACINQVAYAVAGIRKTDFSSLTEKVKCNTLSLFRKLAR